MAEYDVKRSFEFERCKNGSCTQGGWVNVRGDDQEAHYKVTFSTSDESGFGEQVYFHQKCAPFGNTRIPDLVGEDR